MRESKWGVFHDEYNKYVSAKDGAYGYGKI